MSPKDPQDDDLIGHTIEGRYRIISRLGAGGMGTAYRAWDEQADVPVVIKIPKPVFFEDPNFAERFYREIQLLQGLFHPHIVPIVGVGIHGASPYVAMRFLPGGSLSNRRLREKDGTPRPNPAPMLHLWLPAIADALDYVHAQGVVHRDVKPANIFFDAFWGAFLGDFGIAKIVEESETFDKEHTLTATHMGIGTQLYMSPEQFTPKAVIDGRADQYALAVLVYEMLAGVRPFTGATAHLIVEVTTLPAPPLQAMRRDLPSTLVEAVHKGLSKNPNERFATCRDFAAAVLWDVTPMEDEPGVARLLCPSRGCENLLVLRTDYAGIKGRCPKCQAAMAVAADLESLWLLDEVKRQRLVAAQSLPQERKQDSGDMDLEEQLLEAFRPVTRPSRRVSARQQGWATRCQEWGASRMIALLMHARKSAMFGSAGLITVWLYSMVLLGLSATRREVPRYVRPCIAITAYVADAADEICDEDHPEDSPQEDEVTELTEVSSDVLIPDDNAYSLLTISVPDHEFGEQPSRNAAFNLSERQSYLEQQAPFTPEAVSPRDLMQWFSSSGEFLIPGGIGARLNAGARKQAVMRGGGNEQSEKAVEAALKWLAAHQMPDGGWSFDMNDCCGGQCTHGGSLKANRGGATALALLPFLGRGYTHTTGPYKEQVFKGINFLTSLLVRSAGKIPNADMYTQGLAGICLSECYAMTQDNSLRTPAQMLLNYIMAAQDPVGGGWRYQPKQPGDTSAAGWQLMALKSGHMAYLDVDHNVIKKAVEFLDGVEADSGAAYGYTGPGDGPATTAVGLLCRMYLGWKRNHPGLDRGVTRLAKMGPSKDLYFDYYATQVLHHVEGERWVAWNAKMRDMLVNTQIKSGHSAGSWFEDVDEAVGTKQGGRLYCTSLATMILEVYYRHVPLYREEVNNDEFRK